MKKTISVLTLLLLSAGTFANTADLSNYFPEQSGCFILFNLNQNKIVTEYNPTRCAKRIPADSTFKIPLSVMAFDQKLINQQTVFKWDGKKGTLSTWDHNQTPHSWLKYSVVWVSQQITPQLGMPKIKDYLQKFNYGNQDFSGDPGKNNGLTRAWISSSLKVSANEQLQFLKALVTNKLPVSQQAMNNTKVNMYLETSPNGWKLYGKSGSGTSFGHFSLNKPQDGWFVGFIKKSGQTYLFVLNFSDLHTLKTVQYGGPRARAITENILTDRKLF